MPGDIILHMCTKNYDQIMYSSWEIVCDRRTFGKSEDRGGGAHPKNQNLKKMKKATGDIIILHMCTINDNHMVYGS